MNIRALKKVLKSRKTGRFFGPGGSWVDSEDEALAFDAVSDAVRACFEFELEDMEIVYVYSDSRLNVVVPICR